MNEQLAKLFLECREIEPSFTLRFVSEVREDHGAVYLDHHAEWNARRNRTALGCRIGWADDEQKPFMLRQLLEQARVSLQRDWAEL